jgi:hypothetical protein
LASLFFELPPKIGQSKEPPLSLSTSRNFHVKQRKKERKNTHHYHYEKLKIFLFWPFLILIPKIKNILRPFYNFENKTLSINKVNVSCDNSSNTNVWLKENTYKIY